MPIFDYRCPRTGKTCEALVRSADDAPECTCGEGSSCTAERLPAAPAVHFKGTGWCLPERRG